MLMEQASLTFCYSVPIDHPYVTQSVEIVKATLPPAGSHGVRNLFKNGQRRHLHRAILGFVNQCFQQISGMFVLQMVSIDRSDHIPHRHQPYVRDSGDGYDGQRLTTTLFFSTALTMQPQSMNL